MAAKFSRVAMAVLIGAVPAVAGGGGAMAETSAAPVTVTAVFYNDFFGDGEDRFLTGGAQITAARRESAFFDEPLFGDGGYVFIQAGERMYTPSDISARNPAPDDRPYAAYVYGAVGAGRISGAGDHLIQTTGALEIGASGPMLGFESLQNELHEAIGLPEARGWDTQIGNEVYATARLERVWRSYGRIGGLETEIAPFARIDAGMAENAATLGLDLSAGGDLDRGLRLRESALGAVTAVGRAHGSGFSWRAYVGADVKAVATDAMAGPSRRRPFAIAPAPGSTSRPVL